MRKIILSLAVSLDGFIEGPNGEYDWCFTDQDYGLSDFLKRVDSLFMGRKTYELFLQLGDGGAGFSAMNTYVFSRTLENVKKGDKLIRDDIKQEIEHIKKEKGKDIWLFGGAGLTASLFNYGLIDEISMAVHPVLLGSGKPLFQAIQQKTKLELSDAKAFSTGLVNLTYLLIR